MTKNEEEFWNRPWDKIQRNVNSLSKEDTKIADFTARRTSELWKEGIDYWKAVDKAFKELKEKVMV